MAGRGPAPKDPSKLHPRAKVSHTQTVVEADDELRGPDLPDDVLSEPWHPQTRRWWDTWRRSPQAQTFTATDWDFMIDTALMHHTMWCKERWEFASELRLRAAKFGATPEDRMRLRLQVAPPKPTDAEPKAKQSPYAGLRVVREA